MQQVYQSTHALLTQFCLFFFFNDTATTEIYTLSLHDALPISVRRAPRLYADRGGSRVAGRIRRSEEHTSELQSRVDLVCRLLLEKKNKILKYHDGSLNILQILHHVNYHKKD